MGRREREDKRKTNGNENRTRTRTPMLANLNVDRSDKTIK